MGWMPGYGQKAELNQVLISDSFWSGVGQEWAHTLDSNSLLTHYYVMNLVLYSKRLTFTPFDASDVDLAMEMFTGG